MITDKLISDMGNAIFRLETNFQWYKRHRTDTDYTGLNQMEAILTEDLEKLKMIKGELSKLNL